MTLLTPEAVTQALRANLAGLSPERTPDTPLREDQNLLDMVDSFGFAELILSMEQTLDVELPLDRIDLSEIVHVENLIDFISRKA